MFDGRPCRFGFPKEPADATQFYGETCEYERGVADENVNNYNAYLLSLFRGNMDIHENDTNIFMVSLIGKHYTRF